MSFSEVFEIIFIALAVFVIVQWVVWRVAHSEWWNEFYINKIRPLLIDLAFLQGEEGRFEGS